MSMYVKDNTPLTALAKHHECCGVEQERGTVGRTSVETSQGMLQWALTC